jgi:hypothetical protein
MDRARNSQDKYALLSACVMIIFSGVLCELPFYSARFGENVGINWSGIALFFNFSHRSGVGVSNRFDVMNTAHEKCNHLEGNDKLHHVMGLGL